MGVLELFVGFGVACSLGVGSKYSIYVSKIHSELVHHMESDVPLKQNSLVHLPTEGAPGHCDDSAIEPATGSEMNGSYHRPLAFVKKFCPSIFQI